MLRNYFKIAWRNLVKNKAYSLLNILGLATGMTVALLIGFWVYYQYSYDRFLPGYEKVYQVKFNVNDNRRIQTQNEVCLPLADVLKSEIPEIARVAPTFGPYKNSITAGDKKVRLYGLIAGADYLNIYQFPLLQGSAQDALKDPTSVVLTQSTAKALFGAEDAINKMVQIDNENLKVTGILKDLPRTSTFQFDYITPFAAFASLNWVRNASADWTQSFFFLHISLNSNARFEQVAAKTKLLVQKHAPEAYKIYQHQVLLHPLKDTHLYTEFTNGAASGGLIDYVRLFSIVGFLILLIACINFMNLSTARSEKRAREVGVRKAIGSTRSWLILQFLLESVVVAFIAMAVAILFVLLVLPAFNQLTGSYIAIPYRNIYFWLMMVGYALFTGLIAGCAPAFYLSSFRPVKVLKGAMQVGQFAAMPRKILVVLQFSCSVALIISTVVIYNQIQYAKNRPVGYDPNRLITTPTGNSMRGSYDAFRSELMQTGVVSGITKSNSDITQIDALANLTDWPGKQPNEPLVVSLMILSDADFFKTVGIKIKEGRNFTGNYGADSTSVILNEAAVKRMRLKDPVNQHISWTSSDMPDHLRVIGVADDALTTSPFSSPAPIMFIMEPNWATVLTYRLAATANTQVAIEKMKAVFEKYNHDLSFEYHFINERYAAKFQFEELVGKLAGVFSVLAIFISCLGLFGLAAYVAEQRTKEIGIRKVLGASVFTMWLMLSKDFIVLVTISCLIASPVAFYVLYNWLQQYYYRISIGPGVFIISALSAVVITIITISFQSIKAALMTPAKSLRKE